MDRRETILAALAAGGENASYSPVQLQKLLFLLDREAAHLLGGPHFSFQAYDYGPFDRAIYDELNELTFLGAIETRSVGRYRMYALTSSGFEQGAAILSFLGGPTAQFIRAAAQWVLSLNFQQLVSAIYQKYPEMRANSVFRE